MITKKIYNKIFGSPKLPPFKEPLPTPPPEPEKPVWTPPSRPEPYNPPFRPSWPTPRRDPQPQPTMKPKLPKLNYKIIMDDDSFRLMKDVENHKQKGWVSRGKYRLINELVYTQTMTR